jgi:hypothetical protein
MTNKVVRIHDKRRPISYEDDYRPEVMLGTALIGVAAAFAIGVLIWIVKHV